MNLQRILVPTDFATSGTIAMAHAQDLAKHYGAEIIICHVFEPSPYPVTTIGMEGRAGPEIEMKKKLEEELEKFASETVPDGIPYKTMLLEGSPNQEIVRAATEEKVDLIVMPTHGRSGLTHLLLGSVTEKVVRRAPCAVLTVRADKE